MRLRALGTGSKFCKPPLSPPSFVVETGSDIVLIGTPWNIMTTLSAYSYDVTKVSMVIIQNPMIDHIAGLVDLAWHVKDSSKKPMLAAPADLVAELYRRLALDIGVHLHDVFDIKTVTKVMIKEEFFSETIVFVPSYTPHMLPSYALRFESAEIFLTGEAMLNEDWLYKEMSSEIILHMCRTTKTAPGCSPTVQDIGDMPTYLLSKIWLYGYEVGTKEQEQPFPMLYLPRGAVVFDSSRRDKLLSKSRYINENSRKY